MCIPLANDELREQQAAIGRSGLVKKLENRLKSLLALLARLIHHRSTRSDGLTRRSSSTPASVTWVLFTFRV